MTNQGQAKNPSQGEGQEHELERKKNQDHDITSNIDGTRASLEITKETQKSKLPELIGKEEGGK